MKGMATESYYWLEKGYETCRNSGETMHSVNSWSVCTSSPAQSTAGKTSCGGVYSRIAGRRQGNTRMHLGCLICMGTDLMY